MGLRARILTEFDILLTGSGDLGTPEAAIAQAFRQAYDTGTAIDQAQIAFGDARSVNAAATDSLDLAGGLSGSLGGSLTFTAVKEIFVLAAAANDGNLRIGEAISAAFVGPFGASAIGNTIPPGGLVHVRNPTATGWAVTPTTADLLAIENEGAATASYTIILIGEVERRATMSLAAGRLRERISIRRQTDIKTGKGGFERSWAPLPGMSSVAAEVLGKSGRESVIANTLQGVATYQVTIRWREGIQAGDQIVWLSAGNLELNILAPTSDPTGRREMLQIMADTSVRQSAK